jgi:hypothetical protein
LEHNYASDMPTIEHHQDEPWSHLEALAKGELDWLEQVNMGNAQHLKSAILTTERATLTHPVAPLHANEPAHVIGRLLRLLRSAYVELHTAANKAPQSSV